MQLVSGFIVNLVFSSVGFIDPVALAVSVDAGAGPKHSGREALTAHHRHEQRSRGTASVLGDHAEVNSRGHIMSRQSRQRGLLKSHEVAGQVGAPSKRKLDRRHGIRVHAEPLSFLEEVMETTKVHESDETTVDDQADPVPFPPTEAPDEKEVTAEVTVKVLSQGMVAADDAQLSQHEVEPEAASQGPAVVERPAVVDAIQQTEEKTVQMMAAGEAQLSLQEVVPVPEIASRRPEAVDSIQQAKENTVYPSSSATLQVSSVIRREAKEGKVQNQSGASVSFILQRWLSFTLETAEQLQETLGIPYVKGVLSVILPLCVVAFTVISILYSCSKRSQAVAEGRVECIPLACMPQCASSRKAAHAKDINDDGAENLWLSLEEVPVSGAKEIEELLPTESGYDVTFSRALSSRKLVRIQARVEGPSDGADPLVAPITQLPCVLYLATASRKVHAGILPLPLAYASKHLDFTVTMHSPEGRNNCISVCVSGAEVMLFAKHSCRFAEVLPFPCAKDKWQDFAMENSTGAAEGRNSGLHKELLATGAAVEFQECALMLGADVTLVGELIRSSDGVLSLHPLSEEASWASKNRKEGVELEPPDNDALAKARSQVLVSDNPRLLNDAYSL